MHVHIFTYQIYNNRFLYFSMEQSSVRLLPLASAHITQGPLVQIDAAESGCWVEPSRDPGSEFTNLPWGKWEPLRHTLKGTLNNMAMAGRSPDFSIENTYIFKWHIV